MFPKLSTVAACGIALFGVGLAASVRAQVPTYDGFELQARSNFSAAFNLPDGAFFTNQTPRLDDSGRVTFVVGVLPASSAQGIWLGAGGVGGLVYTSPNGAFLTGATVNGQGLVAFEQRFSAMDGLWIHTEASGVTAFETNQPLGASGWGSPSINAAGEIGFRASFPAGNAYVSHGAIEDEIHATEAGIDPGSPYSFLFTPSFNDDRNIAGKVRLGASGQFGEERPDEIRIFMPDGSSTLMAEDSDSDPGSTFDSFDNSVSLTNNGRVAFVADLVAGGRGVFLAGPGGVTEIATEAHPDLGSIEFFGPAANDSGSVAFRAFDSTGLRAIWVGDGTTLHRLVREHDLLETDLGTARIDQNDASPVFGGGPSIDALGRIAFNATLTPPDNNQIEWGTGVFVAQVGANEIFSDGFEGGTLDAWSVLP